jgi:hypothetical protein
VDYFSFFITVYLSLLVSFHPAWRSRSSIIDDNIIIWFQYLRSDFLEVISPQSVVTDSAETLLNHSSRQLRNMDPGCGAKLRPNAC